MADHPTRRYWRSLEERDPGAAFRDAAADEFPEPAVASGLELGRRGFLRAAGFSLAGGVAASCQRAPVQRAIPFLDQPEEVTPGRALWYASTCGACPAGCGVLIKARDGRPVKLEGNPAHPVSRGGLCAVGQASLLGLYDSRRYRGPQRRGEAATWAEVDRDITARLESIRANGGAVRLLSGTVTSPALQAGIDRFLARFADGRHVVYDALSSAAILDAHARTHGRRVLPHYALDRARVLVGVDADFLGTWISPVEFTRAYRDGRSLEGDPPRCSYHVQVESRLSLTGAKADRRVAVAPGEEARVIERLAALVAGHAGMDFTPGGTAPEEEAGVLEAIAGRLWADRGASLVVSGTQDVAAQVLVNFVNHLLGNYGATLDLDRPSRQRQGEDAAVLRLVEELRAGSVGALLVAGVNPVYDLPMGREFGALAARASLFVSLAGAPDETSALAAFVCPDHHPLESWGDAEPVAGWAGVVQPAVRPLGDTRGAIESLAAWSGEPRPALDLVRGHWERVVHARQEGAAAFDAFWDRTVHDGHAQLSTPPPTPAEFRGDVVQRLGPDAPGAPGATGAPVLVLYPTVGLLDGRHAHNPWLQELPDPVSKVTWDNYASLAPATAERLGVADGDIVQIAVDEAATAGDALLLPVCVQPGQHERAVAVALGYGRAGTDRFAAIGPQWIDARPSTGTHGLVGVNAAPLLAVRDGYLQYAAHRITISRISARRELATTQHHHSLVEPRRISPAAARPLIRETPVSRLGSAGPQDASPPRRHEDLWPDDHPVTGHKWGMVIDLHACTGCSGCVVACQVENNIPVVGRDEVRRQREMHWLRIDRYYADTAEGVDVVHQPMLCQHCAHASCESVCPVLATVHSSDGLNEQVYNRCVGTRYCANNCAYKVRRFNWFTYARPDDRENLVLNPDVAVRTRGVMEKCSFCVQRIRAAGVEARLRGAPVADGEVRPACEQSCPAGAIVFGDLNDPASRVSALARDGRHFRVLEELNGRPSVGYLAVVRNRPATAPEAHHG